MKILIALSILVGLTFAGYHAEAQAKQEPKTFDQFYDAKTMTVEKAYFLVYQSGDNYYLEIPEEAFGKDILITTQVVGGYSNYVSPQSGLIQIKKGRNNSLDLFQNKSTTFAADSADFCMTAAIQNSGLVPVYRNFPIVAEGKEGKSVIIDLTQELNSPQGIFNVSDMSSLSSPDPSRSRVEGFRSIENGVVFSALRTQSQFLPNSESGERSNQISTFRIEMLIQRIPDHSVAMKKDHPAYGFNSVERVEYDTRNYRANIENYIKRWNLAASTENQKLQAKGIAVEPELPIEVWIDPITPAPFVESVKSALKQWDAAFEKAGWKNVFRYTNEGTLSYKKLMFSWGHAYSGIVKSVIDDPVSGEILAARISLLDESAKDMQINYFLWCGLTDERLETELQSLELREQILTSHLAGVIGSVLGLKENYPACTAFTPKQVRNTEWLKQWGPTATVVGAKMVDYLVQPEDKIAPELLLPKVSLYDVEAIAYAYGNRTESPSMKACYYAENDKLDPMSQPLFLSNDLLEASELGLNNLERIYPQIPERVANWPAAQSGPEMVSKLAGQAFSIYQFFINQMAMYVGGRTKRTVIRGENETPLVYVPKAKQEAALAALEQYVFSGAPAWFSNEEINRVFPVDQSKFAVDMANGVMRNLLRKEVINSLAEAESAYGDTVFTCSDLFAYFDRVIFANYNPAVSQTQVQLSIQLQFAVNLIQAASENNITGGLSDSSAMLNLYLIHVRDEIQKLQDHKKTDARVKENCSLILLKMNREFFNKTV
ncbi:DUF5117 and DUF5118 domain-containing protein [Mangrovibacterium diazotrophicum]|nr:zinc-dependent metalloprotease [Mangrovibacterium diazotrophicum]